MLREEAYREFIINWQDPPPTGTGWEISVWPTSRETKARLITAASYAGSRPFAACKTREEGIVTAKTFIDRLWTKWAAEIV